MTGSLKFDIDKKAGEVVEELLPPKSKSLVTLSKVVRRKNVENPTMPF